MLDDQWKVEALKRFPEFADRADAWETPYLLWLDLRDAFEAAYKTSPRNEHLIKRVYEFSDWCQMQAQGSTAADDLTTCSLR